MASTVSPCVSDCCQTAHWQNSFEDTDVAAELVSLLYQSEALCDDATVESAHLSSDSVVLVQLVDGRGFPPASLRGLSLALVVAATEQVVVGPLTPKQISANLPVVSADAVEQQGVVPCNAATSASTCSGCHTIIMVAATLP